MKHKTITIEAFRRAVKENVDDDLVRTLVERNSNKQLLESTFRSLNFDSLAAMDVLSSLEEINETNHSFDKDFMDISIESLLTYIND